MTKTFNLVDDLKKKKDGSVGEEGKNDKGDVVEIIEEDFDGKHGNTNIVSAEFSSYFFVAYQ